MLSRKAAIELEQFVKYLLVIASFALLVVFVIKFFGAMEGEGVEQACRSSVTLRSTLHVGKSQAGTNIYPLQCQTQELMVPEKKLPRNLDEIALKQQVYKEISEMMAKCWWMFGNGYYHNLLDDKRKDDQLCHVCYSFSINPKYAELNSQPMEYTLEELNLYMSNTPYSPGLLQGGGTMVGDAGDHTFTPQEADESTRTSRQMTASKLLNAQVRNRENIADFSGIFVGKEAELEELRKKMSDFAKNGALEPTIIIVTSLPPEDLKEGSKLPIQILQEWEIGDSVLENGLVFIVSLNDGKILYATGFGTAGIIYRSDIEQVLSQGFDANMAAGMPSEAIISLFGDLRDVLEQQEFVQQKLRFQQSYLGYITGGTRVFDIGSDDKYYGNDEIQVQGSVSYEPELMTFTPGDYYAVTYINRYWRSQTKWDTVLSVGTYAAAGIGATIGIVATMGTATPLLVGAMVGGGLMGGVAGGATAAGRETGILAKTNDASIPNMIGITSYEGLMKGTICNTNLDDN